MALGLATKALSGQQITTDIDSPFAGVFMPDYAICTTPSHGLTQIDLLRQNITI